MIIIVTRDLSNKDNFKLGPLVCDKGILELDVKPDEVVNPLADFTNEQLQIELDRRFNINQ